MNRYYGIFPKGGPLQGKYALVYATDYLTACRMMDTQFNGSWTTLFNESEFTNHMVGHVNQYNYDSRLCVLKEKYYTSFRTKGNVRSKNETGKHS